MKEWEYYSIPSEDFTFDPFSAEIQVWWPKDKKDYSDTGFLVQYFGDEKTYSRLHQAEIHASAITHGGRDTRHWHDYKTSAIKEKK
jgi:hypothetical protein